MKEIFVFIYHESAENYVNLGILTPCGKMPTGQTRYKFQYAKSWLAREDNYAVDPIHLPLSDGDFYPADKLQIHGIFEDVCPDSWGKKILRTTHNLPQNASIMDYILHLPLHKIGNLEFGLTPNAPDFVEKRKNQKDFFIENKELIKQILKPDQLILGSNASAGGANPKLLFPNALVKMPNRESIIDDLKAEKTCLVIVSLVGLRTTHNQFVIINDEFCLALFRFDMVDSENLNLTPLGYMSLASALGLCHDDYRTDKSYYDYYNIAQKLGCKGLTMPLNQEIFARAIMNILLGNSDDHAKNHGFLCRLGIWELAPVFDIVPQFNNKMSLKLATSHDCDLDDGFKLHQVLGIDETRAREIVKKAIEQSELFPILAKKYNMTDEDLQKIMNRPNKIPQSVLAKYA